MGQGATSEFWTKSWYDRRAGIIGRVEGTLGKSRWSLVVCLLFSQYSKPFLDAVQEFFIDNLFVYPVTGIPRNTDKVI